MAESSRDEIAKLEALYASNPGGRVFTHLAEAYRKAGELERARGILADGLEKHPGYASAHVVLGRVLMDLQDQGGAAAEFRQVLELDPHNMVALRSLADLARAGGRNEEALRYFQELRQHDPASVDVEEAIAQLTALETAQPETILADGQPETTFANSQPETIPADDQPETIPQDGQPETIAADDQAAPTRAAADERAGRSDFEEVVYQSETQGSSFEEVWFEPTANEGAGEPARGTSFEEARSEPGETRPDSESEPDFASGEEFRSAPEFVDAQPQFAADSDTEVAPLFVVEEEDRWQVDFTGEPQSMEPDVGREVYDDFAGANQPAVGETSLVGDDLELDWLSPDMEEASGQPQPVAPPDAGSENEAFPLMPEIGDISSLSSAAEPKAAEPVSFADLTLEPATPADAQSANQAPVSGVLTETIAELYRSQGLYDRAAEVYRALLLERPGDPALEERLRATEAAMRGETMPGDEVHAETPAWDEAFLADEALHADLIGAGGDEDTERAEAWLAGGAGTAESAPTPYAWREQAGESPEDGAPPIGEYFSRLLAWHPRLLAAAGAPSEEEPVLILEQTAADVSEPSAGPGSAAGGVADVTMPWDEPGEPNHPRSGAHDAADSFDEWFGPPESTGAPESAPTAPAPEASEGDDDDDLEMFRSWLQSLKK